MPRRLFHLFPTFGVGGSQVRLAQIAGHFGGRYHHTIYASDAVYTAAGLFGAQVPFTKIEAQIDKHRGLLNVPLYRRMLIEARADVAVTYNWGAIEWAFATRLIGGLRHVHIEDGFGPDEATRQLRRRVWFRRLALTSAKTTVVVPSQVLFDIARRVWRLPSSRIELIANGIDLERFGGVDAAQSRALAKKADDEILIGTVASIRPEKNLSLLIRAFAKLPPEVNARLFIVGGGNEPEFAKLRSTARAAGVEARVVFFGHAAKPELILRAFDVFAMSSATEQMPIGLLEAMACGLPVVATTVGDIASMVSPENLPYLAPSGAEDALAEALVGLARDAQARSRIGAANRVKAATHYDQRTMFDRYAQLLG